MSHVAKVNIEIKDLDALRVACRKVGLEFVEGQKTFRSYQRGLTCDHAIRVPQVDVERGNSNAPYEIGVIRVKSTGAYTLLVDDFAGGFGLTALSGLRAVNVVRAYATEVATKTLTRGGYLLTGTRTKQDGTIELTFNR